MEIILQFMKKILIIFLVLVVILSTTNNTRYAFGGYYQNGKITLWPERLDSYENYIFTANHEFGHHIFQTKFVKNDLKLWKKVVDFCGFDGENYKIYKNFGVKYEEEFADSYALAKNGKVLCDLKVEFLKKYQE